MSTGVPGPDEAAAPRPLRPATVLRPRGQLRPPLPKGAPRWRRVVRGGVRVGHGLVLHDGLIAAPAMAFHFFLSLLPLLAFVGYVVGLVARRRGVEAVLSPILDNLPAAAEAVVSKEVERLAGASASAIGPVAALTFLWIASGGTHGLINAIENVVGAPRRTWVKKRLLALAWVAASLATITLAAVAVVRWDAVVHPREKRPIVAGTNATNPGSPSVANVPTGGASTSRDASHRASASTSSASQLERAPRDPAARPRRTRIVRTSAERVLALTLSVLFGTVVLAAFYRLAVSHSKKVLRRTLPGAAVAVVVWLVISWAFGVYVSSLADYAAFYGSLAAVAVLLVWLWLTSFAILVGAELNSQLEGLRD